MPPALQNDAGFEAGRCFAGSVAGRRFSAWSFYHQDGFLQVNSEGRTELVTAGVAGSIYGFRGTAACWLSNAGGHAGAVDLVSGASLSDNSGIPGVPTAFDACGAPPGARGPEPTTVAGALPPAGEPADAPLATCADTAQRMAAPLQQAGQSFALLACERVAVGAFHSVLWTFALGSTRGVGVAGPGFYVVYLGLPDAPIRFQSVTGRAVCWRRTDGSIASMDLLTGAVDTGAGQRCPSA